MARVSAHAGDDRSAGPRCRREHAVDATDGRAHQKAGPRLLPGPPRGPVKGGSGKQDSEPETGARRGRKSIRAWRAYW